MTGVAPDETADEPVMPPVVAQLSLLGGPLHNLGRALGLVRGTSNTRPLGIAIGLVLWLVLIGLALLEGSQARVFSLEVIGGHARLLIAIPLLFFGETRIDPHIGRFVRTLVNSRIVAGADLAALERDVGRIERLKDSWLIEVVLLAIACTAFLFAGQIGLPGATAVNDSAPNSSGMGLAGQWYFFVCLAVFRFLILRWVWRLGLWWYLLTRLNRLDLKLVPTHPDRTGGLGYQRVVHGGFVALIAAISVVMSAAFAEELALGAIQLPAVYPAIGFILLVDAIVFVGPLYAFSLKLRAAQAQGLAEYMDLAARYVSAFDAKWNNGRVRPAESFLGTGDLQSLADLGNSVRVIEEMQLGPVSRMLLVRYVAWAVVPFMPLLLFVFPVDELAVHFAKMLLGV
jgi:hypothetical protein